MMFIHHHPGIPWHTPFVRKLCNGLNALGIQWERTSATQRLDDRCAILLGTSLFRDVEESGDYLLVDRCSFGDTDSFVSLVFNGHGKRGDHKVPANYTDSRWKLHGVPLLPMVNRDSIMRRTILCGQSEPYSPDWQSIDEWYRSREGIATHFRPHPVTEQWSCKLPVQLNWRDAWRAITLNSSVGVQAVIDGLHVVADDAGSMVYPGVDDNGETGGLTRRELLHWIAWTQWHHDEIDAGEPIRHLFEGVG